MKTQSGLQRKFVGFIRPVPRRGISRRSSDCDKIGGLVGCRGMHIERILLRGVGPFEDVTIELPKGTNPDLADVYLLTGPNGTGKSTILYALAAMIGGRSNAGPRDTELGRDLLSSRCCRRR